MDMRNGLTMGLIFSGIRKVGKWNCPDECVHSASNCTTVEADDRIIEFV
jgi:hypothetical protein